MIILSRKNLRKVGLEPGHKSSFRNTKAPLWKLILFADYEFHAL
jgi:hypothetical protein